MGYRPTGVTAISILLIIGGIIGTLIGIGLWNDGLASYTHGIGGLILTLISISIHPPASSPAIVILMQELWFTQPDLQVAYWLQFMGLFIAVSSLMYIVSTPGLLLMKNWGRYLALLIGIADIIFGIIAMIASFINISLILGLIFGLIALVWGIILTVYLLGEVKYDFGY